MEVLDPVPDVALMLRVREGDESAFEVLHARYQHRMLNFFYGMCGNSHTANDLCQETFLRVWKVRKRYRATGPFAAYLFAIARIIWLERRREQQKVWRLGIQQGVEEGCGVAADAELGPAVLAARSEMQSHILHALNELPEEQRMVFVLRNIHGLSLEDIARSLDCPINTVRSRKILAVRKVRHLLEKIFVSHQDRMV
jgi:RNA polymerase sigma-70 factor, ECF subfamily